MAADSSVSSIPDGVGLIARERERQIEVEGWTPEHDDGHTHGLIALAASTYAAPAGTRRMEQRESRRWRNARDSEDYTTVGTGVFYAVPEDWPWEIDEWKPTPENRIRELVKAGALIAAEIDRLQRAHPNEAGRS